MPKHASANEAVRLGYANGHFGYFYEFGLLSNGFGIPLHIYFLDKDFYEKLPSEFDSPEDQKYAFDNASLRPVLSSFFAFFDVFPKRLLVMHFFIYFFVYLHFNLWITSTFVVSFLSVNRLIPIKSI